MNALTTIPPIRVPGAPSSARARRARADLALMCICTLGVLAGCGEDEPDDRGVGPAPVAEPTAPAEPEPPAAPDPNEACARVIVVAWSGAMAAPESVTRSEEEARARAGEIRAQIAGGEDFATVARRDSDAASSGPRGGLLGTYERDFWPSIHDPIKAPVFALTVGELSEPIRAPYGWVVAQRCAVEKIRTRHILIRHAGARNAEGVERSEADARAMAERLRAEIVGGADFHNVAVEHSDDSTAERGGEVGTLGRGRLAPEYEEAAFALEVDEVSEVVHTDFGFHVIQRVADVT